MINDAKLREDILTDWAERFSESDKDENFEAQGNNTDYVDYVFRQAFMLGYELGHNKGTKDFWFSKNKE